MTTRETFLAFANFRLDPRNFSLWRGRQALKLKSKAFDVLQYLVVHAGQLVRKDELWRAVWPDVAVTEGVLTVCVTEIRHVLGDDPKAPRFIETVHRRGYRFIAKVASSQHAVVSREEENQKSKGKNSRFLPSPQHPTPSTHADWP